MNRRDFLKGIIASSISPYVFSGNNYKKLIENIENFILNETYIGSEIQKIRKVSKIREIKFDSSQGNNYIAYNSNTNSMISSSRDYENELKLAKTKKNNNLFIFNQAHEQIHNIQDMSSIYNCVEEANKSLNGDKFSLSEKDYLQTQACLNHFLKNVKINVSSPQEVSNVLNQLNGTFSKRKDEIAFIRELQAYTFDNPGIGSPKFRHFFYNQYPQFEQYESKYEKTLENIILLYGNRNVVDVSVYVGGNGGSIDLFNSTTSNMFSFGARSNAIRYFNKRKEILINDYNRIQKYAKKLS